MNSSQKIYNCLQFVNNLFIPSSHLYGIIYIEAEERLQPQFG